MKSHPVHYYGTTRFSLYVPESRSWRLSRRADDETYLQRLFAPERMGPRCDIFCDLAVPIYQQMADQRSYRHLVLYSEQMPQRWKDRLVQAALHHPVLELVECDASGPPDVRTLVRDDLVSKERADALIYLFRVDDDDLLAVDYLAQVEQHVHAAHHDHVVSLSSGYAALYEDGTYSKIGVHRTRLSSMGQGAIGSWQATERRLRITPVGHHLRSDHSRPVILDGRRPAYLQTRHLEQDTVASPTGGADAQEARRRLLRDLDALRSVEDREALTVLFPTLAGRLDA